MHEIAQTLSKAIQWHWSGCCLHMADNVMPFWLVSTTRDTNIIIAIICLRALIALRVSGIRLNGVLGDSYVGYTRVKSYRAAYSEIAVSGIQIATELTLATDSGRMSVKWDWWIERYKCGEADWVAMSILAGLARSTLSSCPNDINSSETGWVHHIIRFIIPYDSYWCVHQLQGIISCPMMISTWIWIWIWSWECIWILLVVYFRLKLQHGVVPQLCCWVWTFRSDVEVKVFSGSQMWRSLWLTKHTVLCCDMTWYDWSSVYHQYSVMQRLQVQAS